MTWIYAFFLGISLIAALFTGTGSSLANATVQGAQSGVTLALGMSGALCLWSGIGALLEKLGVTEKTGRLLGPLLYRLFPNAKKDAALRSSLTANICANMLGLGNAATPMGIQAVKRMAVYAPAGTASNELCRLVVLNTASIQLIPASVAAVRSALGCSTPYDILPAVWLTSLCSASVGVAAAWLLGSRRSHA